MSENYFNLLKKYLKNCANDKEYQLIEEMDDMFSEVFTLCREEKIETAKKKCFAANQCYNELVKGTHIEAHVNIIRLPIIAYLYFKAVVFDKAQEALEQSIQASLQLEKKKQSFLLKMYRVQQYHNSARISFRKKEYDSWITQINTTLQDLSKNNDLLNKQEALVYIGMIDQIIHETIHFSEIIKDETYLKKGLHDLDFKNVLWENDSSLLAIKKWYTIKQKTYHNVISLENEQENIDAIFLDSNLRKLYKKSLIKSIAPYLNDTLFLKYLHTLKNEKLAS